MIANQEDIKHIEQTNSLSFNLLRSKFQSNNPNGKKMTIDTMLNGENQHSKQKKVNSNTMPKRILPHAGNKKIKPHTIVLDVNHHTLKRNSSSIDLNSIHTPSLWSNTSSQEESDQEDPLSKIPRTTSFTNDLSQRLNNNRKSDFHYLLFTPDEEEELEQQQQQPRLKRSTTINSISSSTSHLSLSKQLNTKKSIQWYVPHWFNHHLSPPQSPTPFVLTRSSAVKRNMVIQELVETEKRYALDMQLIQEIYYDTAATVFTKIEIKQIFINLLDIIQFEKEFLALLEAAFQTDNYQETQMTLGLAFHTVMNRLEQVYADYCKKHEDALSKIQELSHRENIQNYFNVCKEKMKGRTTCWDLPSLLIKPVQRVLKYPLLLKEIVALTPEFHQDYDQLLSVMNDIQQVADHINQIKKRKDLVEQILQENKNGMNKKLIRINRKKIQPQQQGIAELVFEDIYKQFEARQEMAHQFIKDVQFWIQKTKATHQSLIDLVDGLDQVYGETDNIELRNNFKKIASQLSTYPLENLIEDNVYNRTQSFLKLFKNPMNVIEKRNRKWIDFNQCQYLVTVKNETPDKQLQLSTEAYISLNAYLIEELPVFLSLANEYFDVILHEFTKIQLNYWQWFITELHSLLEVENMDWKDINDRYQEQLKNIQWRINEIYNTSNSLIMLE